MRLCVFFKPHSYIKLLRGLVCVNMFGSCMRSALIASRAKSRPNMASCTCSAVGLFRMRSAGWLVFAFQAPSTPGNSPPNSKGICEQIVNLAKNRSRILSENKIEILDM